MMMMFYYYYYYWYHFDILNKCTILFTYCFQRRPDQAKNYRCVTTSSSSTTTLSQVGQTEAGGIGPVCCACWPRGWEGRFLAARSLD